MFGLTSLRRVHPGAGPVVAVDLLLQADGCKVVVKLLLLFCLSLGVEFLLIRYGLLSLLIGLLNAGFKPMGVVSSWFDVLQ